MTRTAVLLVAVIALFVSASSPCAAQERFSFGLDRDSECLDRNYPSPCIFPGIDSPCAVPCRPDGLQCGSVPCAFETACPSQRLPCHGVSYGNNPFPLFRLNDPS
jgi:hypothetical protein